MIAITYYKPIFQFHDLNLFPYHIVITYNFLKVEIKILYFEKETYVEGLLFHLHTFLGNSRIRHSTGVRGVDVVPHLGPSRRVGDVDVGSPASQNRKRGEMASRLSPNDRSRPAQSQRITHPFQRDVGRAARAFRLSAYLSLSVCNFFRS